MNLFIFTESLGKTTDIYEASLFIFSICEGIMRKNDLVIGKNKEVGWVSQLRDVNTSNIPSVYDLITFNPILIE